MYNGPKLFNVLPIVIGEFDSNLETFKRKLDIFLESVDDKPLLPGYVDSADGNSIAQQIAHSRAQALLSL